VKGIEMAKRKYKGLAVEQMYRIKIKEIPGAWLTKSFTGVTVIPLEAGGALLIGSYPDQAALRGLLEQLWNLNITVISVDKIENENKKATRIVEYDQGET
jgi:hypothetical protein